MVAITRGSATVIRWVEVRDAAKPPVMHRTALTQNYPAPNVKSAEADSKAGFMLCKASSI